jgi:hypothetical protein
MVISDEMKFPPPVRVEPFKPGEELKPVDGVAPIKRIGDFHKEWRRSRQEAGRRELREKVAELPGGPQGVKELVDQVNRRLDDEGILLHLVLVKDEEGYTLDVYDCTDNQVCTVIRDFIVQVDELPLLAYKLENRIGLLVDTVS